MTAQVEILQECGRSAESVVIEDVTDSVYSHTALRSLVPFSGLDCHGQPISVQPGDIIEARNSGVTVTRGLAAGYERGTVFHVYSLREPLTDDGFKVASRFGCRQVGKPYWWSGACRNIPGAKHVIAAPSPGLSYWDYDKWYCSPVVAAFMQLGGQRLFNSWPAWKIVPAMVPESLRVLPDFRVEVVGS